MTRGRAIALGTLTAWPFAVPAIGLLFEATGMLPSSASEPPAAFVVLYALLLMTPIVIYGLLVFYLIYLFTTQMPLDRKLVWAALLVIGHVFTMPVFWYRHIWKPRSLAPLEASSRFSLLVFGPLLIVLLLPLMYLFPMTLSHTVALRASLDSIADAKTAIYWLWVVGPILVAAGIFVVGRLCYPWFLRSSSRRMVWIFLWGVFSLISFPVIWYTVTVLRSVLPTDAPPNNLKDLTRFAMVLALVVQPAVLGWLFVVSRLLRGRAANLAEWITNAGNLCL